MTYGTMAEMLYNNSSPTDAWFRGFKGISDFLTTAGLTKTADTGQVNWATATFPVSNTDYSKYEVRVFGDAEQATDPIFFRIDFLSYYVNYSYVPTLRIQVGTGSDGAGNLTGTGGVPPQLSFMARNGTSVPGAVWLLSSDGSGFAMLAGEATSRIWLGLERGRDIDGNSVPGVVLFYTADGKGYSSQQQYNAACWVWDLNFGQQIEYTSLPATNWRPITTFTDSLVQGMTYPFSVIIAPTQSGIVRGKLMVGAAWTDFYNGSMLEIPRFSAGTKFKYKFLRRDNIYGLFGLCAPGASSNTQNPAACIVAALFWE